MNPAVAGSLVPIGIGALPEWNGVTAVLYIAPYANQLWARFIVQATGTYADVRLPATSIGAFGSATYALSGSDLWILSGGGPVTLTHYVLTGSPLPSAAAFVSTETFGDSDSRSGALLTLADGSVVAAWHQQGITGAQGNTLALRRPGSSAWQLTSLRFTPTGSSNEALAQHPADGSVWLFISADAFSSIAAARLSVAPGGLTISWADPYFIDDRYGEFDSDPELPDLSAAADPSTGTIALAYQTAVRQRFSDTVTGSQPAVARIPAVGSPSFVRLPIYVERTSTLGVAARAGELWLGYRPINLSTLAYDTLQWGRFSGGSWTTTTVGKLYQPKELLLSTPSYPLLAARLSDGLIHVVRA